MKIRKFTAKIAPLIGLIAVGVMLATPASANIGAPVAVSASFGQFSEILNPVFGGCLDVTNASTRPGAFRSFIARTATTSSGYRNQPATIPQAPNNVD